MVPPTPDPGRDGLHEPVGKGKTLGRGRVMFLTACAAVVVLALVVQCARNRNYPRVVRGPLYVPPGGIPVFRQGAPFYYQAPPERQTAIDAGLPRLTLGMSREQVRAIMGDPDTESFHFVPTVFNWNGEYRGISWEYIIRSYSPNAHNTNDDIVGMAFNTEGLLDYFYDTRSGLIVRRDRSRAGGE